MHGKALLHARMSFHACLLAKICFHSLFLPRLKLRVKGR